VPVSFQVVEEGGDQWRVQVGDVQRGGRLAGARSTGARNLGESTIFR
jgi:hypothetical protein